jgi:hypothetical protein
MRSLKDLYLAYLPAIITLVGAVLVALGFFLGWFDPSNESFQQFRFVGAGLAAVGLFGQRTARSKVPRRLKNAIKKSSISLNSCKVT